MNKKVLYSVVILVILVAVLFIGENLGGKKPSEKELRFFPDLTEQSIGSLNIREGAGGIKVRRKGDVWVVSKSTHETASASTGPLGADDSAKAFPAASGVEEESAGREYPVDSASIASALEKLTSLKKDALVSENPEKQNIFEVDTGKGIRVDLEDNSGKSLGSFIIGKSGADYNSNYIRSKGSNAVYMAAGGIRYAFFTDLDRWRNKSILKFDKGTAKGLTLTKKDGSSIILSHADSGNAWSITEPIEGPAKSETVDEILSKLSTLTASGFQDSALADTAMGFNSPELGVTLSFNNGSSRNVVFGKKNGESKYWVKTDGKNQIFLIGEYYVNQINKTLDDLKSEPVVKPVDTDTLKKK